MKPKKFFYVMCGALTLMCILLVGSVVGGKHVLQQQSTKLVELKAQDRVISEQQVSLVQAKKDIEKYSDINTIARSVVPQDKDQAKTIREISKIAAESGIELKAITFTTSNLGQAAAPAPKPATDDKTQAATTTPAAPAAPPLSQVKPVEGIQGVFSLELTISSVESRPVPYKNFLDFLSRLESNRRTAHVSKISVNPSSDGKSVTFNLTLSAYVKP